MHGYAAPLCQKQKDDLYRQRVVKTAHVTHHAKTNKSSTLHPVPQAVTLGLLIARVTQLFEIGDDSRVQASAGW